MSVSWYGFFVCVKGYEELHCVSSLGDAEMSSRVSVA